MKKFLAFVTLVTVGASVLSAQNYFDDDIYFDASKSTEPSTTKNKPKAYNYNGGGTTVVTRTPTSTTITSLPGADTYTVITDNTRNVDEYNRRTGSVLVSSDTIGLSSEDPFYYTRRIARFENPEVLDQLGDSAAYLYAASSPETQTVNVIVNNYESGYNGWDLCNPYWNCGWPGYYSPFYVGLSWSWGWGWNSWAWGPGYWGPGYWGPGYWGPGWSWAGPSWGWGGPGYYNPRHPGAINRPGQGSFNHHRPGNVRPSGGTSRPGSGVRPGSGYGSGGRHHGAVTSGTGSRPGSGVRPGSGYGTNRGNRPSTTYNGSGTRPGSGIRQGSGYSNSTTRHSSGNSVGSYSGGNRSTYSTRNSGNSNRGSYSGGSRGGYSGGGGSRGGGGYSGGRGRH